MRDQWHSGPIMSGMPGAVLPPPGTLRSYALWLQQWAQERECEPFIDALVRRLELGNLERQELSKGLHEVIAVQEGGDPIAHADRFSATGLGAIGILLTVQGLHQLTYYRPRPGEVPQTVQDNIYTLNRLEPLVLEKAPSSQGAKLLERYRRSLVKRRLLSARDVADHPSSRPSAGAVPGETKALEPVPPSATVEPQHSMSKMMSEVASQASKSLNARDGAARTFDDGSRGKLLWALLGVLLLGGGVQLALTDWGGPGLTPAEITEMPVVSMVKYTGSVKVRVQGSFLTKPRQEQIDAATKLYSRFVDESDGTVRSMLIQGPNNEDFATVTNRGVEFVTAQ